MAIDRWTLAQIRDANTRAGFYFFSRQTMRFFGDTMRSFTVNHVQHNGETLIILKRVRPMRDRDGRNMGGLGDLRLFDPTTGDLSISKKTVAELVEHRRFWAAQEAVTRSNYVVTQETTAW